MSSFTQQRQAIRYSHPRTGIALATAVTLLFAFCSPRRSNVETSRASLLVINVSDEDVGRSNEPRVLGSQRVRGSDSPLGRWRCPTNPPSDVERRGIGRMSLPAVCCSLPGTVAPGLLQCLRCHDASTFRGHIPPSETPRPPGEETGKQHPSYIKAPPGNTRHGLFRPADAPLGSADQTGCASLIADL